ncbi:chorismate-binding protein [Dyadobacter tibetensis]|uniref:chorismate-binding protein n=1 Tax=Dyadobacter tibetensis TaxID=1211851 RepID=UPI00046EA4C7|nr:chorismate-binding protein [Dyadobacter tibetensis]
MKTLAVLSSERTQLEQFKLTTIWSAVQKLGLPAAIWKLPHTQKITVLISLKNDLSTVEADLVKLPAGFMIAPFSWDNQEPVPFIEGDIQIDFSLSGISQGITFRNEADKNPVALQLGTTAATESLKPERSPAILPFHLIDQNQNSEKAKFMNSVKAAVEAIGQHTFQKVVLSRAKKFKVEKSFEIINAYQKLIGQYAHAFVSLVNLPERQEMWLGASPELLVCTTSGADFSTMSLAGTQPAFDQGGMLIPKNEIRWGQKEIEEHALVSRYIVECFKKIRLREYQETGPKTQQAGNLYHLQTDFHVDMKAVHFDELGSVMLKLLHPTSAVCGTPKEVSKSFIDKHEDYERSFYSGFLGPIQIEGASHLFVNLRTLRLKDDEATFFAGAGITEDSNASKEWEETEMKCDTLLKVIGG